MAAGGNSLIQGDNPALIFRCRPPEFMCERGFCMKKKKKAAVAGEDGSAKNSRLLSPPPAPSSSLSCQQGLSECCSSSFSLFFASKGKRRNGYFIDVQEISAGFRKKKNLQQTPGKKKKVGACRFARTASCHESVQEKPWRPEILHQPGRQQW